MKNLSEKGRPSRGCSAKPCVTTTTTTTTKGVIDLNDSYGDAVMPCNVNRSNPPTIARRGCYCGNTTLRCRPFQGLLSGKCQASAAVAEGLIFGVIVGCHCVGLFALVQLLLLLVWGVEWAFWICAPIMSRTDLSGWFCCTTVAGGVEFHLSETRFTRVESCD